MKTKIVTPEQKELELARVLCKWNRKEITPADAMHKIWGLYTKEALKVWNDPLEKLVV